MRADPVALLKSLVALPSQTGQEAAIVNWCADWLAAAGFEITRQPVAPGRANLLAHKGQGERALLWLAHVDTVAPDPAWAEAPWQQDPLVMQSHAGRLYGLGCSDMKAGLAALLAAALQVEPLGYTLKIALTVDEEAWSEGAWTLVESGWCDDVALALVPELAVDSEQEVIGIGRRGHFALEMLAQGSRQHGALAHSERPAVMRLAEALLCLEAVPLPGVPELGSAQLLVRHVAALAEGFSLPERACAQLSYLSLPGETAASVLATLRTALADVPGVSLTVKPRPTPSPEAYLLPADHPAIAWLQTVSQPVLGHRPACAWGVSVADENVLASRGLPVLSLAPLGGHSHRAGEWVSQASLEKVTAVYAALLEAANLEFPGNKKGLNALTGEPVGGYKEA
ncbi:MAG: M20 family metallopeptidase [Candidatus Sericytochromatia bacterium]